MTHEGIGDGAEDTVRDDQRGNGTAVEVCVVELGEAHERRGRHGALLRSLVKVGSECPGRGEALARMVGRWSLCDRFCGDEVW